MTQLENKGLSPSHTPSMEDAILMASRRIGSWEVLVTRRPLSSVDLANRYDAASGSWERMAARFQLEAAYKEPLLTSHIATVLGQVGPEARVLDCGVGSGSLSIALDSILTDRVTFHGIDTSAKMLVQARSKMHVAGLRAHYRQADVLSLPYDDQFFDVVMAAHVLEHLPDPKHALREMIRVLKPGGMVFVCATRPSLFGTLIQLKWRTWAVTEKQGVAWLHDCQLADVGYEPVHLGACAGVASTAFWARRPA
ncbi:demethylmenaquinone methyltransferase / 2-methoxy-6-polyprenyl-1,4-benzoquinol methylase [Roseivivax lentus]|uniref:Demethylmenaquinone methyltransferase / 2-methoxy-6-polyprenyl-1,4-benzoquinol methylase n=1 Tax=Roseivivax lentus TaxID=633194 RepID=A0A1N7Q0T9_9RHOB|nr:class I SAM-dependent methyltransferase [Roseivivax lentus]SIT16513.1 demethylmenaquinone methyltransferase / 2-methoxy-6-polyprenyl-1,4-benzoquinol methylase [Roseivivax lentus]